MASHSTFRFPQIPSSLLFHNLCSFVDLPYKAFHSPASYAYKTEHHSQKYRNTNRFQQKINKYALCPYTDVKKHVFRLVQRNKSPYLCNILKTIFLP